MIINTDIMKCDSVTSKYGEMYFINFILLIYISIEYYLLVLHSTSSYLINEYERM